MMEFMQLKLEEKETYELAELNFDAVYEEISDIVFRNEFRRMGEKERACLKNLLAECIEFDIDVVEETDNTRSCFRVYNGKLIVVRRRKLNLELLFLEMTNIPEFVLGDKKQRKIGRAHV